MFYPLQCYKYTDSNNMFYPLECHKDTDSNNMFYPLECHKDTDSNNMFYPLECHKDTDSNNMFYPLQLSCWSRVVVKNSRIPGPDAVDGRTTTFGGYMLSIQGYMLGILGYKLSILMILGYVLRFSGNSDNLILYMLWPDPRRWFIIYIWILIHHLGKGQTCANATKPEQAQYDSIIISTSVSVEVLSSACPYATFHN